jgi:N-acyl-D-aspartate/D-glutamate deacylase
MRRFIGRVGPLVALAVATACSVQTAPVPAAGYDILINNARIIDGAGNPWYRGAVATRGDRIVYVGPAVAGMTARRVIDAHEQVVSPGFIDMLGSSEYSLLRGPHAVSKVMQGVTSEITGEVHSAWPNTMVGQAASPQQPWSSLDGYF